MVDFTRSFAQKLEATHWGKAVLAALIAGTLFLLLEMLLTAPIAGESPWLPVRRAAAIALGPRALWQSGVGFGMVVTALLIHFALATLFAWILTPLVERMRLGSAMLAGAGFGLLLYLVDFYLLTQAFPWFAPARHWMTLVNHLIFGAVLAGSYLKLRYGTLSHVAV